MAQIVIPIFAEKDVTITHMLQGRLRCGAPVLFGMSGQAPHGQRAVIIGYEWPEQFRRVNGQQALESMHLARFDEDIAFAGCEPIYAGLPEPVAVGLDPPDFRRLAGGERVGVELAHLTLKRRNDSNAIFQRLQSKVLATDRARFRRLAGRIVYVSFGQSASLPPAREKQVQRVIRELGRFEPFDPPDQPLPIPQMDMRTVHEFGDGRITSAPLATATGSAFHRFMNFELGFAFTTTLLDDQVWETMLGLVRSHDVPGVDHLIVSAGAPLGSGLAYPADSFLGQMVIDQAGTRQVATTHITRIFIHLWAGRAIAELTPNTPGVRLLCGELPLVFQPIRGEP